MIISTFIEVAWLLWLSCQLGPRSSTKGMNGISEKVRKKLLCLFFICKGTYYLCITWSDWRRPHKPSRKSMLRLQLGDVSPVQVRRVTLGLQFCIRFPSFRNSSCRWEAVLVNHAIYKIINWLLVWGRQHTCRGRCVGLLYIYKKMVACGTNSAEGQLQSGMRSGCHGEYMYRRGCFRIDIVGHPKSNYHRQVAAL